MGAYLLGEASVGRAPMELVRLTGVHQQFDDGAQRCQVLRGVDLQLNSGELTVVCGPSGSGKSTLLKLIGLLGEPSAGSVHVTGLRVAGLSELARSELRHELFGYLPQSYTLVPVMTALDNVLLPLSLRQRSSAATLRAAGARARELLSRLGLASQMHAYPKHLSASARQRVAIARALVNRPRLVVADEPGARQDADYRALLMDIFAGAAREDGTAFLISTRDQRVLGGATRTLQLCDGRLAGADSAPARQQAGR